MDLLNENWCVIIPMANEEQDFQPLVSKLQANLDSLRSGKVYLIVDTISVDDTRRLCERISAEDDRFAAVWAPENRNVVDAYMKGYRTALENGHDLILEMDAGLSHDPDALPMFLEVLNKGYDCAFGSRFMEGGAMVDSNFRRRFLSRAGSLMSNICLGTRLHDMTSGYQGFKRETVERFVMVELLSTGHFYQTELRFLLKKKKFVEIPIQYRAHSPNVNINSLLNSLKCLIFYTFMRLLNRVKYL
jgi:dolichol-phosphate mannosyltransferase